MATQARSWTIERRNRIVAADVPKGALTVVVFGHGHGEGVLVGLPDGRVGVVDGSSETDPPMEALLSELGVERLAFACLTHPHQDHYGGLGAVMKTFGPVDVAMFPSISGRSVKAELEAEPRKTRRVPASGRRGDGLKRAFEQQHLATHSLTLAARMSVRIGEVTITVLAPTERARAAEGREVARASSSCDPNQTSAALMLRWGQAGVMLGGDLVNAGGEAQWGWSAARDLIEPCQVAKVSHHASHNGHDDAIWNRMSAQLAIVTPFKHAQRPNPPRESDVERLLGLGVEVAVTSPPHWWTDAGPFAKDPADPPASEYARDCALAVQLDHAGQISRVVLAGRAAFYRKR